MDLEKVKALGLEMKMLKALEREMVKALGLAWVMERVEVCR
jgi:hypothetical protein